MLDIFELDTQASDQQQGGQEEVDLAMDL